jgi:hypothetical protein
MFFPVVQIHLVSHHIGFCHKSIACLFSIPLFVFRIVVLQLDDGHHGATVVSNTSDHEATRNGDSKVWQSTFSIPPIFLCTGAGS